MSRVRGTARLQNLQKPADFCIFLYLSDQPRMQCRSGGVAMPAIDRPPIIPPLIALHAATYALSDLATARMPSLGVRLCYP